MILYHSADFRIVAPEHPHVSRADGGHLKVAPLEPVEDRTKLSPAQAKELMKLTMVAGEAMRTVLGRHGIEIGRINYQDNGNWHADLHIHLYGRALGATGQKWGSPLVFPPTHEEFVRTMNNLEPLSSNEQAELTSEIEGLLATEKYQQGW